MAIASISQVHTMFWNFTYMTSPCPQQNPVIETLELQLGELSTQWESQDSNPSSLTPNHCFFTQLHIQALVRERALKTVKGLSM